jgi:hypothetical protein
MFCPAWRSEANQNTFMRYARRVWELQNNKNTDYALRKSANCAIQIKYAANLQPTFLSLSHCSVAFKINRGPRNWCLLVVSSPCTTISRLYFEVSEPIETLTMTHFLLTFKTETECVHVRSLFQNCWTKPPINLRNITLHAKRSTWTTSTTQLNHSKSINITLIIPTRIIVICLWLPGCVAFSRILSLFKYLGGCWMLTVV